MAHLPIIIHGAARMAPDNTSYQVVNCERGRNGENGDMCHSGHLWRRQKAADSQEGPAAGAVVFLWETYETPRSLLSGLQRAQEPQSGLLRRFA